MRVPKNLLLWALENCQASCASCKEFCRRKKYLNLSSVLPSLESVEKSESNVLAIETRIKDQESGEKERGVPSHDFPRDKSEEKIICAS